jgi:beta-lactamase class A
VPETGARDAGRSILVAEETMRTVQRRERRQQLRRAAGVVVLALSVGTAGVTLGQPRTAGAAVSVPTTPVGRQLSWLLALSHLPLPTTVIAAHFDATFLAEVSPAELNTVLGALSAEGAPDLLAITHPESTTLSASVAFGTLTYDVSLSVDPTGMIDGLFFTLPKESLARSWSALDAQLAAVAPGVGFLAAKVTGNGACTAVHSVAPTVSRPLGSMFKLFVLGALATAIGAHRLTWDERLTVTAADKVGGSGTLDTVADGTQITVEQAALKMISISDNAAADLLIALVGRPAVQATVRAWTAQPSRDIPFLTVQELFALHLDDYPTLADRYLALDSAERATFLSSQVDHVSSAEESATSVPRDINTIEWFASPDDLCRVFSGLKKLAAEPGLAPLATILSTNNGGIGLSTTTWPTIWFKGGSEPGVQTLGYLARNRRGATYVVIALSENPSRAEGPSATNQLAAVIDGAFALLR